MFDKIPFLKNLGGSLPFFGSSSEEDTGALKTTPVRWRTADAVYVGWSGDVWMYRELVLNPMMWEDAQTRLAMSAPLERLLGDLGATSQDLGGGMATLSRNREIHIASITYEAEARPPEGTPDALRDYLEATLDFLVPTRVLLIGVKLRSSLVSAVAGRSAGKTTLDAVKAQLTQVLSEDVPDLDAYEADMNLVRSILESNGAGRVPSREVLAQLESWYNLGRTTDVTILEAKDCLYIGDVDRIEIAAVTNFDTKQFTAPHATWLLDAMTHPEGASVVSIRAELQPSSVARARIRRGQRKILAQMEEEAATGDLERPEHQETFDALRSAEQFFASTRESILSNCSMLLARRVTPEVTETYLDELGDVYGIELKPLEHRQLWALEETLPCSTRRVNPFVQDLTIATIAYAGLQGYSNLGDPTGVFTGLVDPDYIPMYLNPLGAPAADMPPGMLVAGDPGSGKTFLCQMIALQSAIAGMATIFINPKGFDTLAPFAQVVDGDVVSMSSLERSAGAFDPFRYADPEQAAEIATSHILSVLGNVGTAGMGFTTAQSVKLGAGLRRGAIAGARCVNDALNYVDDDEVKYLVRELAESNSTFALGIGKTPAEPFVSRNRLTLIEFDRPLDLPEKGVQPSNYSQTQKISIAAMRLVTRASLHILANANGGVLIVDEAWTFLSNQEGLSVLQSMGRLGRSQNILPIFATQRVDDLLREGVDMEGYLSRVFVMKLADEREARAALKLCGLEATQARIDWLRGAGPRRGEDGTPARPAMALHRDLKGRHAAVMIGPVPDTARAAFSTNPEDRKRIREERERAARQLPPEEGQETT